MTMAEASPEQIRRFRLRSHHLDRFCSEEEIMEAVGACGMQNSPPGAWETVSNPGVILWKGEAVGIWNGRKKGKKMEIRAELWKMPDLKEKTAETAETYVRFRGLESGGMEISWTG